MAFNLLSLPVELILQILCCEKSRRPRRLLCEALRLSCRELDCKTVRYYGYTHYKRIKVPLSEAGINSLLRISQGPLASHIRSVTFDCSNAHFYQNAGISWDYASTFDENIMNCLKSNRYVAIVGPALSQLPNLNELLIRATYYSPYVDNIHEFSSEIRGPRELNVWSDIYYNR